MDRGLVASNGRCLVAVAAGELSAGEDVAFESLFDLLSGCAGRKVEQDVDGVEIEDIAVGRVPGRARAAVAGGIEIVVALARAVGELSRCGKGGGKGASFGGNIEEGPVGEGHAGCVGVGEEECEASRGRRERGPCEVGRSVGSVAGDGANDLAIGDAGAGKGERGFRAEGVGSAAAAGEAGKHEQRESDGA
jgi:hypothetical protein